MNNLIPLNGDRFPSLCEVYGHNWRVTNQPGKYQCHHCETVGYCPDCTLTIPPNILIMRCKQHQEARS